MFNFIIKTCLKLGSSTSCVFVDLLKYEIYILWFVFFKFKHFLLSDAIEYKI